MGRLKTHTWAWGSGNNSENSTKNWPPQCRYPCHDQGNGVRKLLLGLNTVRKGAAFKATLLLALCWQNLPAHTPYLVTLEVSNWVATRETVLPPHQGWPTMPSKCPMVSLRAQATITVGTSFPNLCKHWKCLRHQGPQPVPCVPGRRGGPSRLWPAQRKVPPGLRKEVAKRGGEHRPTGLELISLSPQPLETVKCYLLLPSGVCETNCFSTQSHGVLITRMSITCAYLVLRNKNFQTAGQDHQTGQHHYHKLIWSADIQATFSPVVIGSGLIVYLPTVTRKLMSRFVWTSQLSPTRKCLTC